jgi:hypothetical protein
MAAESLGTAVTGGYGVVDLFTETRKYDKDKSKFFIWRERGYAVLAHFLVTKCPKWEATDPEPRHFEDGYRAFQFTLVTDTDSSSGSLEDVMTFVNAEAAQLQAGQLLKVQGGGGGATQGTASTWTSIAYSADNLHTTAIITYGARSEVYATEEVVEILSIGTPGGTNTAVTVRRGVGATTIPTAPPNLTSGTYVWHIGEAAEEGSGSPQSFSQNPVVVNNYVQDMKVAYEMDDVAQNTDLFGENEWQRKARNARRDFSRRLERGFLSGRMNRKLGAGGKYVWYTGGFDEWVPNNTDNRLNLGKPLTQTNLNTVLKGVGLQGSMEKLGVCGYGFLTQLANAAADRLRYNEKLSNDLGLEVQSYTQTGGLVVHFMPDYEMSMMGKDNECYFADTMYLRYMYMKGMDIHIDKGKDGKGLQANDEAKTKHQIRGVVGMKRTFRDSHFHLYGLTS